jgi:hypothetical protein
MTAFNLGWDCDNNAAVAATIIAVIKGYSWMQDQGWDIVDRYHNTTRAGMPEDETITGFAHRIADLAARAIVAQGGEAVGGEDNVVYRIRREPPANVEPLVDPGEEATRVRQTLEPEIRRDLASHDPLSRARAAYLAICLDLAAGIEKERPERWAVAVEDLNEQSNLLQVLFHFSPTPMAEDLRSRALAAGVEPPAEAEPVWTIDLRPHGDEWAARDTPLCIRLPELGRAAQDSFREADIDALIDSCYWLDRAAGEFAERCDELDRISDGIGIRLENRDWENLTRDLSDLERLLDGLRTGDAAHPADEHPMCPRLSRDVSALEAALDRRDAELAANQWQKLRGAIQQVHDVVDAAAGGAEALHKALALGSRERVGEAVGIIAHAFHLPAGDDTTVRGQR